MYDRIRCFSRVVFLIGLVCTTAQAVMAQSPQVLTFSGRLNTSGGQPVNGSKSINFAIFDELSGLNPALWNETQDVVVHGGNFTVLLGEDVGNPLPTTLFDSGERYLQMTIDLGTPDEEVIAPRTRLGAVGNAFHANSADNAANSDHANNADHASNADNAANSDHANNAENANNAAHASNADNAANASNADVASLALSVADNTVGSPKIINGSILFEDMGQNGASGGQVMKWNGIAWVAADEDGGGVFLPLAGGTMTGPIASSGSPSITMGKGNFGSGNINGGTDAFVAGSGNDAGGEFSTVGGGHTNFIPATGSYASVGGGRNNMALDSHATVGGGDANTASGTASAVGGGSDNRADGANATVGGGLGNDANGILSTVGGGSMNHAIGNGSAVGGGEANSAGNDNAAIGGGIGNFANGTASVVGGGGHNRAYGEYSVVVGGGGETPADTNSAGGNYSAVGGGTRNSTGGLAATVGGGSINHAQGSGATVPGGENNDAMGDGSFAAGTRAKANHWGAFVWADRPTPEGVDFASTNDNQFLVRASGGVGINTNTPTSDLHVAGSISYAIRTVSSSTVLGTDDCVIFVNGPGTLTVTLPPAGLSPGRAYTIKRTIAGPGQVIVAASAGEVIEGGATKNFSGNGCLTAISDGVEWFIINYETSI